MRQKKYRGIERKLALWGWGFNIPSLVNSTLNNDCYKKIGGTRKVVSTSVFTSGGVVGR